MNLQELFDQVPDIEIENLMADSRVKRPNSIFFCIQGMMFDGHRFINQAIANGARVIIHSEKIEEKNPEVTYIRVKDVLAVFNQVADAFYGYPSHHMKMFGITGTNGKSSTACIIKDIRDQFYPTGYIGTISIEYGDVKLPPLLTTPNIDDLHGILRDMHQAGVSGCALEASSIGIEQGRVDSIDFDTVVFTNLTYDHLDYHGTMDNYFAAKKKLFEQLKPEAYAITNIDDPYGMKIVEGTPAKIVTYGIDHDADYRITKYQLMNDRTIFTLHCNDMDYELESNLVAKFNLYNLLGAIASLNLTGMSMTQIIACLKNIRQVEGRMERIDCGQPFNVLVDFAHTPDGIEKLCQYATAITEKNNRIIAITGSAGKRDSAKRPVFGEILDRYADMIILTEDDPRDEEAITICNEIAQGIKDTNYLIIEDRHDAIRQAIELADEGDTIVVMGKGDEKFIYREFGREPYDGDDVVCRDAIMNYYFAEEGE